MKKLFFSAICLIAFSSVTLASKKNVKKELNCSNVWSITYHYAREAGFNTDQANAMAIAAYDNCLGCSNTIN